MATPSLSHAENDNPAVRKVKKTAKRLKLILEPYASDIKHGNCLDICAQLHGFKDWNIMSAALNQDKFQSFSEADDVDDIAAKTVIDEFVQETLEPRLAEIASNQDMFFIKTAPNDPDDVWEAKSTGWRKKIEYSFVPKKLDRDLFDWQFKMEVSKTAIDINYGELNFTFPKKAYSVAMSILPSDVFDADMAPRIARVDRGRDEYYVLSLDTVYVMSCSVVDEKTIFEDVECIDYFKNRIQTIFQSVFTIYKSFEALSVDWKNKEAKSSFEEALWKYFNEDEPIYTRVPVEFYKWSDRDLELVAQIGQSGPYIVGPDGNVNLGVCSIIYHEQGTDDQPKGYYIAKYNAHGQLRIYLGDRDEISEQKIAEISRRFGIPIGTNATPQMFYKTPAFLGLRRWVKKHPEYAARLYRPEHSPYLKEWYPKAVSTNSPKRKAILSQET